MKHGEVVDTFVNLDLLYELLTVWLVAYICHLYYSLLIFMIEDISNLSFPHLVVTYIVYSLHIMVKECVILLIVSYIPSVSHEGIHLFDYVCYIYSAHFLIKLIQVWTLLDALMLIVS